MIFVGIDPGVHGAVCFMLGHDVQVVDTPTEKYRSGKKMKSRYLVEKMIEILEPLRNSSGTVVVLEQVNAMPGDGSASAFSLGHGLGLWEGIVLAMGLKLVLVRPAVWKRKMKLTSDKNLSLERARWMHPELAEQLKFKYNNDRAEAILLAHYGRTILDPQEEFTCAGDKFVEAILGFSKRIEDLKSQGYELSPDKHEWIKSKEIGQSTT